MARITQEQLQRLQAFLDTLPDEAKSKCSICNSTLTHIVKQAEAETGVGTATVARVLAEKVNETALPADRVTGDQLRDRVRRSAGEKESGRTAQISKGRPTLKGAFDGVTVPLKQHGKQSRALLTAEMAIGVMESIADDDPDRYEAFNLVRTWMDTEEAVCRK